MEEEKAAAYYDELTRKGGNAARFKQGLGFSSSSSSSVLTTENDAVPARGSALPSSSFLSSFVRASKSSDVDKQTHIESIQNKLKKIPINNNSSPRVSDDRSRARDSDRNSSRRRSSSRDRESDRSSSRRRDRDRDRKSDRNSSRRRSSSRDRDRESDRNSLRCRSSSRDRDRESDRNSSRRRSSSKDRESDRNASRRRSSSRDRESDRNALRRRSSSRDRESDRNSLRRRSSSRDRDRDRKGGRRKRSRSVSPRGRRSEKRRGEKEDDRKIKKERSDKVDYAKLIQGYDNMSVAERVKAKMKLQLSATAKQDEANGMGSGWERFNFDKDAPLDDEEIEAAEDDGALVKHIGQTFRFSAVEARREEKIKATHDEAMFGTSSLAPAVDTDSEADGNNCTRESPEPAPVASLISDQVRSLQQGSWRDRINKA